MEDSKQNLSKRQEPLNIILLGPQGAGKGTQSNLLVREFGLFHLNTGDLLREIALTDTPLGKKVDEVMHQRGNLVPTELAEKLIKERVLAVPIGQGIIFDGSPRKIKEAYSLLKLLTSVSRERLICIYIDIDDQIAMPRLSKRLTCRLNHHPLKVTPEILKTKKCPIDGSPVFHRDDDTPEKIKNRLAWSHRELDPIIVLLRTKMPFYQIDGNQSVEKVFQQIRSVVKNHI